MAPIETRLLERLKRDLEIPEGSEIFRLYPSVDRKREGAWIWLLRRPGYFDVGSIDTMRACIAAKRVVVIGDEIVPT